MQPCQLGNMSLHNMVLYPLLDMRGGAYLCKPLNIPGLLVPLDFLIGSTDIKPIS